MDLHDLREEYSAEGLSRESLLSDPIEQFRLWIEQAMKCLPEPNAMVLSTVGKDLRPSSRVVLLKSFDQRGFVFFTNYESTKARQISENPNVSLLFPWFPIQRQVVVSGVAEKVPTAESLAYFITRPLGSRLGAWTSPQSKVITSRSLLEGKLAEIKQKFADGKVPLPSFWGGFRINPVSIEFWQGRKSRLHDRFLYTRESEGDWKIERLAP